MAAERVRILGIDHGSQIIMIDRRQFFSLGLDVAQCPPKTDRCIYI
jgi:hypothetical protein